jgi:uncharacterized protein (TIGR02679 family)
VSQPDRERLERVFGHPGARWVIDRARQRMERGQPLVGPVTLAVASEDQRRTMDMLLGRPPGRGKSLTVPLEDVDFHMKRSGMHPDGLAGAVQLLTGPVMVRAEVRAAAEAAWQSALEPLEVLVAARPEFESWYRDRGTAALLRRRPDEIQQLVTVLRALPANGISLSKFATDTTGDAHALDVGRPLATLVLSAIRATWWSRAEDPGTPALRRRALWDTAGVLVDELSSTVLILNVHALPDTWLGRHAGPARQDGEPVVLTLRQIARHQIRISPDPLYVCENPVVIGAAADRLGAACPPLVCVNGHPTTAAVRLLEAAHACEAPIFYHGDFDWGGVRIANLLRTRVPWRPWRFDRESYLRAAQKRSWRPLSGAPAQASWDPSLSTAMQDRSVRVEEEDVLEDLLQDLASSRARSA